MEMDKEMKKEENKAMEEKENKKIEKMIHRKGGEKRIIRRQWRQKW